MFLPTKCLDFSTYCLQGKSTCKGAMGYSFAAGTTDGPGAFDFTQSKKLISSIN